MKMSVVLEEEASTEGEVRRGEVLVVVSGLRNGCVVRFGHSGPTRLIPVFVLVEGLLDLLAV